MTPIQDHIDTVLTNLIKEVGEKIYTDEFKKSKRYKTSETQLKTLGIILSKFCDYAGEDIKTVALSAFEDSNFNSATKLTIKNTFSKCF